MAVNWQEVQKALSPIKDFEDLTKRLRVSFGFRFVEEKFNFTMPELINYTQKLLGGDARGRYNEYAEKLIKTMTTLEQVGVYNVVDLKKKTEARNKFEVFVEQSKIPATDTAMVLKYLVYWLIPGEKYLSGLVQDPVVSQAVKKLHGCGIRTNLELLQKGMDAAGRISLADSCGLPEPVITDLVNRADFSRLPWASKATISNIIGAGYGSLEKLATADADQLYADFFRYGKSIGKNLKLGNEIENSFRIAKIVPAILKKR